MRHNEIKHPLCYQVTLWYDEFTVRRIHLTALDRSQYFVSGVDDDDDQELRLLCETMFVTLSRSVE